MLAASGAVALLAGLGTGVLTGSVAGADAVAGVADGPPVTCAEAQQAWAQAASAQVTMSSEDPQSLRQGFVAARDAVVTVSPPTAIVDEWEVVGEYLATVAQAVEAAGGDAYVQVAVKEALSDLDTTAMTQASDKVTTYLKAGCGASEEPSSSPSEPESDESAGSESSEKSDEAEKDDAGSESESGSDSESGSGAEDDASSEGSDGSSTD